MFNPLCMMSAELLEAFERSGKKYFVRQSYARGQVQKSERSFLISHYGEYKQALEHFEALAHDPFRCLYRWSEPQERAKLRIAASQPIGFRVYACVVMPDWKEKAQRELKLQVKKYIDENHPGKKEGVEFELYPHFGEVFVRLSFRKQEIRVSLAEVEKKF